jgi:hypothetical protein
MTYDEKLKITARYFSQANPFAADPDRGWEKHIPQARRLLAELGINPKTTSLPVPTGKRLIQI